MAKNKTINVKGIEVTVISNSENDYISLTDIAKSRNSSEPYAIINNWLRSRLNLLAYGRNFATLILNLSNSRGLKMKLEVITLFFPLNDGLKQQMQLGLFLNQEGMVAHTLTRTLHLSSLLGFPQSSNYI